MFHGSPKAGISLLKQFPNCSATVWNSNLKYCTLLNKKIRLFLSAVLLNRNSTMLQLQKLPTQANPSWVLSRACPKFMGWKCLAMLMRLLWIDSWTRTAKSSYTISAMPGIGTFVRSWSGTRRSLWITRASRPGEKIGKGPSTSPQPTPFSE